MTTEVFQASLDERSRDPAPDPRPLAAAIAIVAAASATLLGAFFFQYGLDIQPCPMCLEQRYAYYFAIAFGSATAFAAGAWTPGRALAAAFAALGLAMAANAVFGAFHAGVEWDLWKGPSSCTGAGVDLSGIGNLLEQLDRAKVVPCDRAQWRLFGISLAGYNALISAFLSGVAWYGLRRCLDAKGRRA